MVARDARIGNDQVLVDLSPHRERRAVQDDVFLLAPLHKYEGGKHSGTGAVMAGRSNGIKSHGWVFSPVTASAAERRRTPLQQRLQSTLPPRCVASPGD